MLSDRHAKNYGPTRDWQKNDGTIVKACFNRKGATEVRLVLNTGKLESIQLSELTPSQGLLATKLEAEAVENYRQNGELDENKRSWITSSSFFDIHYSDERLWYRFTNKQEREYLVYIKHTSDYVELYDPTNRHFIRLFSDRAEALGTGLVKGWVGLASGGWNGKSVKSRVPSTDRPERTWPPTDQVDLKRWTIMDSMQRPDLMTSVSGSFVRMDKGKVHIIKEDGKRSIISIASLLPSDRIIAENFEISAVNASKNHGDIDPNRRIWDSVSDGTIITYIDDRLWSLKTKKKGEIVFMVYSNHTTDFVELYNPKQQQRIRLFEEHLETHKSGEWLNVGNGNWKQKR